MKRFIILIIMTTIVGVAYPNGLVLARTLLAISPKGERTEQGKIYHTDKLMWGFAGKFDERVSDLLSDRINELCKETTIEELVDSTLWQIMSGVNSRIKKAARESHDAFFYDFRISGLFGALYKNEYGIWHYHGEEVVSRAKFVVVSPYLKGFKAEFDIPSYKEALDLAIEVVGRMSAIHPQWNGGIRAFHMTRGSVAPVYYRPISL